MYYVYMIKDKYNNLYIGVTNNPIRRLSEHNSKRGASYTKKRCDFYIVFLEEYETLAQAREREVQIKKWRRDKKEKLISLYENGLDTRL